MPSSVASSEPLSSPVSSPSPPPQVPRASTSTNNGAPAGLDSGSELSELTDDEQESTHRNTNREERPGPTKKRKRSQIIPTPMWGWAYADGKVPREEEEEEHAGPARAMEEEEDDDDRDSRPRTGSSSQRRRTRTASGPPLALKSDDERDFDLDDTVLSADEADDPPVRGDDADDGEDMSEDEEKDTVADVELGEDAPDSRAKLGADAGSADETDEDILEDDEAEPLGDDDQAEDDKTIVRHAVAESEDEADDLPLRPVAPPIAPAPAPATVAVDRKVDPVSTLMDVDDTAPIAAQVSPIIAAAAASSIMAGAAVVDPPSPSASTSNASEPRNASRSPTRSPTPEVISDREVPVKRGVVKTRAKPRNARRSRRRVKADVALEQDVDPIPTPLDPEDPDADPDDPDMDSPEMDMELDLQPAHRAEALDVLATIELKYAMLRESLYVEKMEALAWEEALVTEGTHPEMIHLQAELSKRRDKRLELAGRRRDYEVVNVTKRRKLDDDGVWSWWKLQRDELQTEMISDAQRRRRQIDRDKRASDRPQPIRRIPSPPREVQPAPALRDLVKSSPYDLPESRRRPTAPASLSYPQLSTLPQNEIGHDLEYLYAHRRMYGLEAANARMNMGPLVGHPLAGPPFEPYNVGMGMLDGPGAPGRFPSYVSLQQGPLLPGSLPPQMMQGYSNAGHAPRLQHHHPPPMPHPHSQLMIDQDIPVNHRPAASHSNMQMQHPPSGGHIPLLRRSISPVPVSSNGLSSGVGPSSFGGSKSSSRIGMGGPGPGSLGTKDGRRAIPGARNMDVDGIDREKERERMFEPMKSREHVDRDWPMERENDRERVREWERDREREREYEREMERSNHIPHNLQRHQHAHQHGSSGPANHTHGAHHHHVYHHHAGGMNGQGPSFAGSNGLTPGDRSPLHIHEHEAQRQHLGVPVEVIELSSSTKSRRSSHSSSRKGREDLLPPVDSMRDRGRIGPGMPPYERTSSSLVQGNYPPSPRAPAGLSTAPASMAPSRRGSWSAPDEAGVPRPASSSSNHPSLPPPHRVSSSASLPNRPQVSPTLRPHHSPSLLSPPRSNGIRLPPLSPPQGSNVRSPIRGPQGLPGPAMHPSGSSSKSVSPKVTRRTPPPPSLSSSRPKSPLSRARGHSGTQPSIVPLNQKLSRMSPANIPSPPIPQPTAHSPSRLSNVGVESDSKLVPAPKVKAVPVD